MAVQDYTLTFVNGKAENVTLPIGTYTYVSQSLVGYEGATIESFTVTAQTQSIDLTVEASGRLNITVTDDVGTAITSGSLQLSDQSGATLYGDAVTITDGAAAFDKVPFAESGIGLYVSQSESDETHDPIDTPQSVNMTTNPQTENIENERKKVTLTVNITDKNYSGITSIDGGLTVNG